MLKGIHPAISPTLLATLSEMGHGDEILFADAHFPAHTFSNHVIRCDGVGVDTLLTGVIPLFELDQYVPQPLVMMQAVDGDELDPTVEEKYCHAMSAEEVTSKHIERLERYAFYERVKQCYAVVLTGETAKYGNIILKKGVTSI
ncbi:L-fucose mutarotase [Vibrio sp. YIC-376]|uniref:L-fucose mutarotase n=1 Tax=Vibrio sp. YIC-376 TaxID=3136162 RepID=UPI00402AF2FD